MTAQGLVLWAVAWRPPELSGFMESLHECADSHAWHPVMGRHTPLYFQWPADPLLFAAKGSKRRAQGTGPAVRALDATGAGDVAADAARYETAAAALSTTGYGAVAPIPRPEAVRAALNKAA